MSEPASGSPDSELVGRLEQERKTWPKNGYFDRLLLDAAKALRALEAENKQVKALFQPGQADAAIQGIRRLQREADQLREWLREALDGWSYALNRSIARNSIDLTEQRISEIRSKMEKAGG
jgi:hypothetical protein